MSKIEIRSAYGDALKALGDTNASIVVLEADVGSSTKSAIFGKTYPERYFNVGVSELHMASMAAGLATTGLIPFVNTFAAFLTTRALDPIQSLIASDRLNVKLAGGYAGFSDSYDGSTHQAVTDISMMRSLPNMTVISVCDGIQTKILLEKIANFNGPVYLRLSRAATDVIYNEKDNFTIGKGKVITEGTDVTIIATGYMVQKSLAAAEILTSEGVSARVIDMYSIKPIDSELILKASSETGAIVTVEEHSIIGGLGSAVSEVLTKNLPTPLEVVGVNDTYGESGDYEELLSKYGLSAENIVQSAKKVISRK